jgi:hypothetical protein
VPCVLRFLSPKKNISNQSLSYILVLDTLLFLKKKMESLRHCNAELYQKQNSGKTSAPPVTIQSLNHCTDIYFWDFLYPFPTHISTIHTNTLHILRCREGRSVESTRVCERAFGKFLENYPGRGLRAPYTIVYDHIRSRIRPYTCYIRSVYDRISPYYMVQYYDRISP